MKGSWPRIAPVILAGLVGCNGLAGIREGIFDPCMEDAGDPVCLNRSSTASSSSSSGSGGGEASSTSGAGGASRSKCGNGVVDVGEECDDGSPKANGCTQCKVDCAEPGAFKDSTTAHCYWVPQVSQSFFESSVTCELSPGGRLATVTSADELALIDAHVEGAAWIGAKANGANGASGEMVWLDDEPWAYAPWAPGQPILGGKSLCVKLEGEPLLFKMDDCALNRSAVCERGP